MEKGDERLKFVYVSHPYTGNGKHNMKMARKYCRFLKEENPDWCIINPLDNNRYMHKCDYQHEDYMDIDLSILEKCDAIVMCGEWESSRGCSQEYRHASYIHGMEIYMCKLNTGFTLMEVVK